MNMYSRLPLQEAAEPAHNTVTETVAEPYRLHVARSLADIVKIGTAWRALERQADGATLFQSFEWCRNCAEHDLMHGEHSFFVYAVFSGEAMVAVLPLRLQKKQFRTVLTGLGEPFQQYTEMLMAHGHDAKVLFAKMRDALAQSGADFVYLAQVRSDGALEQGLNGEAPPTGEDKGAPFVPLSEWPDFDTYFKSLNAKSRKNMRNLRNKLGRQGKIAHQVAFEGPLLAGVISRTFEGRTEWLERMGLTSRAFRNAGFEQFLDRFKKGTQTGVKTVAMSLTLDGHPIAEQWGFIHQKRYYAYISTWDTHYQEFSPGRLHLEEVLRTCSDMGIEAADFMVPASAYKLTFAPQITQVHDYVLPLNFRGRIYGSLWVNHLRPWAKKLAYSVPTGLRKGVFARLFGQGDS